MSRAYRKTKTNNTKKNNETKKKSKFFKGMIIYISIMVVAIGLGLAWFWGFIEAYEEGQAKYGMDSVMDNFNVENIDKLFTEDSIETENSFNSISDIAAYYKDLITDKTITFEEANEYIESKPMYTILADDVEIATVTLKVKERNSYKFKVWTLDKIQVDTFLPQNSYTVSVPTGSTVTINGITMTEADYKEAEEETTPTANTQPEQVTTPAAEEATTAKGIEYDDTDTDEGKEPVEKVAGIEEVENLKDVLQYLTKVPTMTVYEVNNFINPPEIKGTDESGAALVFTNKGNAYTAGFVTKQALIDEVSPRIKDAIIAYGENYINVSNNLGQYAMPDSALRHEIRITDTSWYPSEYIKNYEFENIQMTNFVTYTDDCFAVDIKFDLMVYFTDAFYKTSNAGANLTWIYVKKDDIWYLTDVVYKTE